MIAKLVRQRTLWSVTALFATVSIMAVAYGQDRHEGMMARFLQKVNERSNVRVMAAFREVVAEPHDSTVELLIKDERVALGGIVDSQGWVITKASQIMAQPNVDKLVCRLSSGDTFAATIAAHDRKFDVALLKIDASGLHVIEMADGEPEVGSLLATTCPKSEPLAIGVMSSAARAIQGEFGVLGIRLPGVGEDVTEARVMQVFDKSAADKSGLLAGDLIRSVNDIAIQTASQLQKAIRGYQPGDVVRLTISRGDSDVDLLCTLGDRFTGLEGPEGMARHEFQNHLGGPLSSRRSGFPTAFQHDTFLRPEDCGGPVVNLDGKVVGLNIARAGRVASYAIPASILSEVVQRLKSEAAPQTVSTGPAAL
ncbi:PDZ domain-containing protein [Blastopirellula sp. JC732]|uniref:PDZ domain-containing protein n=1 Tax=Blastopirellula sediminis TaxID=2894196 RepID=A0A9X1MQJ3_9BACT|nr:PDZ domain-containing protein [Blastopirellula sediminis]MCC9605799.1 PDZ domain-containing protein [Blastopirellula sediminis]MCC9630901.1 PDZ domain-containing protein [Blastopirellula sediminis]